MCHGGSKRTALECCYGQRNPTVEGRERRSHNEFALYGQPFRGLPLRPEVRERPSNQQPTTKERRIMKKLTTAFGAPVDDNQNIKTAGKRGPALLENIWFIEKMAHFDREVIPERRMHAKGAGAFGTFTVTHDITRYTKAKIFSEIGKKTQMFARFSTVAGERGAADAERDIRGFALKFYTDEGNWDLVGNNTPVFF